MKALMQYIQDCSECPYFDDGSTPNLCLLDERELITTEIPEWCTLEDA